ncbi:hypothetical protein NEHOM01_0187 [Nematocida homosporus]|uniref:uncharacterized protein n=1 Tax=Nematocida homosporus TaxID=1912981 RepID=UPI00221FCC09|nr:uncharacterized protein NEHOM01_0187 [Nematocida homosporus]KAI5184512.1 hypothetical protein NEHOM01_0187 [Nematocida homosporus]
MKSPQRTRQEARNDKEYTPEHQNPYLFNRLVRRPSQDKSLAKFRPLKDCVSFLEHNARHSTRTTPLKANAYTTKISHCRVIISSWTVVRLCVLLVLLQWTSIVSGSSMEIDQPGLPSSEDVLRSLEEIGFRWSFNGTNPCVVFCSSEEAPESTPTPGVTDNTNPNSTQPNSTPNSTPRYTVDFSNMYISFTLPTYPDSPAIVLHEIRKIDMITAEEVLLAFYNPNKYYHQDNLLLLCRLLNLLACKQMVLRIIFEGIPRLDGFPYGIDSVIRQKEAEDTIRCAGSAPFHLIIDSNVESAALLKYIFNDLVILRPVLNISLSSKYVPDISGYLKPLSLTEDSALTICYSEENIQIDLKAIQKAAHKCSKIIFRIETPQAPPIAGLEEEVSAEGPTIILAGKGNVIQCIGKENPYPIHVHVLSCNESHTKWVDILNVVDEPQSPCDPRIFANKVVLVASDCTWCDFPIYYEQVMSVKFFAEHGISVGKVEFEYADGRGHFFKALESLCKAKALSKIPTDLADKNIACLDHALSGPCWELKEPVNIRLNRISLTHKCQRIRYTTLSISGDKGREANNIRLCNNLLRELQNINAQELRISNVCNCSSTNTNFDLTQLKLRLANPRKYNLNVKTLILNNVDDCILYRMLSCYDFTCSSKTEIHLLNHRLTSLAIAQILTLPMTEKIAKLVIEGVTRLNEVKHFHQRKELNEFSLFNYLEERKEKKETEELDLHKLVLILEPILFDSYNIPLQALKDLGVQVLTNPNNDCITEPPFPTQPHMIDIKNFTYCITTLDALKIDLAKYKSTSLTQPNPTPTPTPNSVQPDSITNLFLRISDAHFLTRTDLNTIICWIGHRFKDLTTLWLANFKLTESTRKALNSYRYILNALPYLQLIQIEDTILQQTPIELQPRSYINDLFAITSDLEHTFTAVSYEVLSQLYTHCDKIENLIPNYDGSNETLHTIITSLQKLKKDGDVPYCPCCQRTLYMPSEEMKDDQADVMEPNPQLVSDTGFDTLCYLDCKVPICIYCASRVEYAHMSNCNICDRAYTLGFRYRRLAGTPASVFIFPDMSANKPATDSEWLQTRPWTDNHHYFYILYDSLELLIKDYEFHAPGKG